MPKTNIFWWFRIKQQFFQLIYEKICTLLFVTLSHMIGLSSNLLPKTWNTFALSNIYILMHNNTFAEDFFWKHEIFTVSGGLKIENFMIFFALLVLSPYCFLKVKSCVEHVFQGFRVLWCRKSILFDDLPSKNSFFLFGLISFQCSSGQYPMKNNGIFIYNIKTG